MGDFVKIETQEEFDKAISARLQRARETYEKKYEGFLSPEEVEKKYEGFLSPDDVTRKYEGYVSPEEFEIKSAEYEKKIQDYESHSVKTRIAQEAGLSLAAVEFLKGETEDEIKKSAQSLKEILGKPAAPPLGSSEKSKTGSDKSKSGNYDEDEALRETLRKLKGE